jgi:serine/threonine protein kinase
MSPVVALGCDGALVPRAQHGLTRLLPPVQMWKEAKILAKLQEQNYGFAPKVYRTALLQDAFVIVMEHLEGAEDLQQLGTRLIREGKQLPDEELVHIASQFIFALHVLHGLVRITFTRQLV